MSDASNNPAIDDSSLANDSLNPVPRCSLFKATSGAFRAYPQAAHRTGLIFGLAVPRGARLAIRPCHPITAHEAINRYASSHTMPGNPPPLLGWIPSGLNFNRPRNPSHRPTPAKSAFSRDSSPAPEYRRVHHRGVLRSGSQWSLRVGCGTWARLRICHGTELGRRRFPLVRHAKIELCRSPLEAIRHGLRTF